MQPTSTPRARGWLWHAFVWFGQTLLLSLVVYVAIGHVLSLQGHDPTVAQLLAVGLVGSLLLFRQVEKMTVAARSSA
ncbi:hypothetical protein [Natronobiforma cellulositropha]|uniref:hypothetical protein n=1 Tax=Natronobiforma cellulositropha TaxID=1679076 RepID=UPI0021D5995D|nr:hypothetical protein [Natronobiforma cellulositropha]